MKKAFIFPGQGSQAVAMAKDFYDNFSIAKETFLEVDEALKQNLSELIFNGPIEELTLTTNAQPAIMVASMAILRTYLSENKLDIRDACSYVAGHSLGEYTALCAAGAISLSDTAKLLRIRGESMQNAVAVGQGAMAAVLGMDIKQIEDIAEKVSKNGKICQVANDNCPGQIVISGNLDSINEACDLINQAGFKTIKLQVSAPFHCSLMKEVEQIMFDALNNTHIEKSKTTLIANFTAQEIDDKDLIASSLVNQICGRVRWRETILRMKELGVGEIVEVGPGKVLNNMNKRIDSSFKLSNIMSVKDICL